MELRVEALRPRRLSRCSRPSRTGIAAGAWTRYIPISGLPGYLEHARHWQCNLVVQQYLQTVAPEDHLTL